MLVRRAENADELAGEKFHADERGRADRRFRKKQIREQLFRPVLPPRADIVARDRNASCRAADRNRNDNLEKFHDDSEDGKRNLREFGLRENLVPRAVLRAHILNRSHRRDKRNLRKKARYAERKKPARDARRQHETARAQPDRLHPAQIAERKKRGENLPEHCRHRRAHHSPLAHENKNRVKDDVYDRARNRAEHRKLRASVRADNRVHRLPEHVERNSGRNPEKIFLCIPERLAVHPPAEKRDDFVLKNQVDRRNDKARGNADDDCVSHRAVRLFAVLPAEADAHERACSVANHDCHRKRDDRQRKDDRVRRVSRRAEVRRVRDKNLVNDVVQRRNQKRDDARKRVLAHQRSDAFRLKKLILIFLP